MFNGALKTSSGFLAKSSIVEGRNFVLRVFFFFFSFFLEDPKGGKGGRERGKEGSFMQDLYSTVSKTFSGLVTCRKPLTNKSCSIKTHASSSVGFITYLSYISLHFSQYMNFLYGCAYLELFSLMYWWNACIDTQMRATCISLLVFALLTRKALITTSVMWYLMLLLGIVSN